MEENENRSRQQRIAKRRRRRQRRLMRNVLACTGATFVILLAVTAVSKLMPLPATADEQKTQQKEEILRQKYVEEPPDYSVQLLPVNEYSRPGPDYPLTQVNGIVIHYVGNPGTTAQQNHNYFKGLAQSKKTSASSHFIVGLDGEIIQCVPCSEIAYASNERNADTISIEVCHPDETGKFNEATRKSLIHLTAWLMGRYDLDIKDVIRHYDVTGKHCPKYYVEHPTAWEMLKDEIVDYIDKNGVEKESNDL